VEALGYKANVPARTRDWVGETKESVVSRVTGGAGKARSAVAGAAPDPAATRQRGLQLKDKAERNPLGLALAGAAVGFVAGIFAPSTRKENETLGPLSDHVKATAVETGQEAVERGKQVAQAAAQSAMDTAREEGAEHASELRESLT